MKITRDAEGVLATFEDEVVSADLLKRLVKHVETEHPHAETLTLLIEPAYFTHFADLFLAERFTPVGTVTHVRVWLKLIRQMREAKLIANAGLATSPVKLDKRGTAEDAAIRAYIEKSGGYDA
jgi:hypothetical protein